jgi:hypothetical protein
MSKIIEKLTEGIIQHDVRREGAAVLKKWEATGLLEGLDTEHERQGMAVLLENQAKQLLKEANTMSGGDVQGFATVAFPIVRRVFGGLLAQKLVSVQPMSLPSGLVFFLDFTRDRDRGPELEGESIFGQGVVGSQVTQGVDIGPGGRSEETGFYNLANGYSSARGCAGLDDAGITASAKIDLTAVLSQADAALLEYDADLVEMAAAGGLAGVEAAVVLSVTVGGANPGFVGCTADGGTSIADLASAEVGTLGRRGLDLGGTSQNNILQFPKNSLMTLAFDDRVGNGSLTALDPGAGTPTFGAGATINDGTLRAVRRLSTLVPANAAPTDLAGAGDVFNLTVVGSDAAIDDLILRAGGTGALPDVTFAIVDPVDAVVNGRGALAHGIEAELESSLLSPFSTDGMSIPEIDIQVDSVSMVAETKKMKAKWTQELQQDLNAYHNLDAEVESLLLFFPSRLLLSWIKRSFTILSLVQPLVLVTGHATLVRLWIGLLVWIF